MMNAEFGPSETAEQSAALQGNQVKLSDDGGTQYTNTLAMPPLFYAIFPRRLAAMFSQPQLATIEYSSQLVEDCLQAYAGSELVARPLLSGYLYLFVEGYLFAEYRVINPGSGQPNRYQEIDLAVEQGNDIRHTTKGKPQSCLLAPLNTKKVELGFSKVQWSWLRINSLGGLPSGTQHQGPVVAAESNLAVNDQRLKACGNGTKLMQQAQQFRNQRLVTITESQLDESLQYKQFKAAVKSSEDLRLNLPPALAALVSSPLTTERLVFGYLTCVLPDPFSLADELSYRYKLAWQLMPLILADLANPNHEENKAQTYPFATWFDSALLINKEILNPHADDAAKYFGSRLKDMRRYVHRADIEQALGVEKRQRVVELITLTKQQLVDFLQGDYGKNDGNSKFIGLQRHSRQALFSALQDYHFLPLSTEARFPEQPVREQLLERLGHIIAHLGEHPRSYDITLDGSIPELKQYQRQAAQDPGLIWLVNLLAGHDPVWQLLVPADKSNDPRSYSEYKNAEYKNAEYKNAEYKKTDYSDNDYSGSAATDEPDFFQVTRRGVQLVCELIIQLSAVRKTTPLVSAKAMAGIKHLMKTHAGIDITTAKIVNNADIYRQYQKAWHQQPLDIPTDQQKQLLSQYLRRNKPVIFTELEGANIDAIRQQRAQLRSEKEQSLADQKTTFVKAEQQQLGVRQARAEDDYLAVKARLTQEQQMQWDAIEHQQQVIYDANQNYNQQSVALQRELQQLENDHGQAQVALDKAKNNLKLSEYQSNQAQQGLAHQQKQLVAAEQKLALLKQQKADGMQLLQTSMAKNKAYFESQYGPEGARQMEAKMRESAALTEQSHDRKIAAAQASLIEEKARLTERQTLATQYRHQLKQQQQLVSDAEATIDQANTQVVHKQQQQHQLSEAHQVALAQHKAELDQLNSDLEANNRQRQEIKNSEYQHLQQVKAQQKAANQSALADFNQQQQAQLNAFDSETESLVTERIAAEQQHEVEKAHAIEQARDQDKLVFDLSQPGEEARMQQYNRLHAQQYPRRIAIVETQEQFQLLMEKQVLHANGHAVDLPEGERWLLTATLIDPDTGGHLRDYLEQDLAFAVDVDQISELETVIINENTMSEVLDTRRLMAALDGVLSVIEIINLYYILQKQDSSLYGRLNVIGGILDSSVALNTLTQLANSLKHSAAGNPNIVKAYADTGFWKGMGVAAALASAVVSGFDVYRTAVTNEFDDAWMGHAMALGGHLAMTTSAAMLADAAVSSWVVGVTGVSAAPIGIAGLALVLLGHYLVATVWQENDDALEYALSHGPFGAKTSIAMGRNQNSELIVSFAHGKVVIDSQSFRLLRIEENSSGSIDFPYFHQDSEGNYFYLYGKQRLLLGKMGEPIANKKFNDASELEAYFQRYAQTPDKNRFEDGVYRERNFVLDASLWQGKAYSGHSYYESLINALYPFEIALSVSHITEDVGYNAGGYGVTADKLMDPEYSGNKVTVTIKAPYFQVGRSELYFELRGVMDKEDGDLVDYAFFVTKAPYQAMNAELLRGDLKDENIQFNSDKIGTLRIDFNIDDDFLSRYSLRVKADDVYHPGNEVKYYTRASLRIKQEKSGDAESRYIWFPNLQLNEIISARELTDRNYHQITEIHKWIILED